MSNLLVKIIDSVIIVIRVVRLIAGCIFIFVRISLFFKWPLRILGGFTWRLQKSIQFVIVRCWLILFFLSFRTPRGYGVKLTYLTEIIFINLKRTYHTYYDDLLFVWCLGLLLSVYLGVAKTGGCTLNFVATFSMVPDGRLSVI